jgi:hypothetical protein
VQGKLSSITLPGISAIAQSIILLPVTPTQGGVCLCACYMFLETRKIEIRLE